MNKPTSKLAVEVAGIEPASLSLAAGLLRAQPIWSLGYDFGIGPGSHPSRMRVPWFPSGKGTSVSLEL
jgi:hypothetical protein